MFLSSTTLVYNVGVLTFSTDIHSNNGVMLFVDPTVLYFSSEHIHYLLIATVPCVCLVLVPAILLCVYPTKLYRRLARCLSARKQLAITAFAEALHGCFKDGLNGTQDYRALAGLMLTLPVIATWNYTGVNFGYSQFCVSGYLFLILSLLISYVRPCKSTLANFSLSYHSLMMGVIPFGFHLWERDLSTGTRALELTLTVIPSISHALILLWMGYTLFHYMKMHFGCRCMCPLNIKCTELLRTAKQSCCRKTRDGYQPLMNI